MQKIEIENKKRSKIIKLIFLLGSVLALVAAVFVYFEMYKQAVILGGAFMLWLLIFQFADFQYINFTVENKRVTLRYYPVGKFGKKEFSSIEFSFEALHNANVEKTMMGLFSDLVITVKTRRGIAEYPSVSLTALRKEDIHKINHTLQSLLENK